jgi:hypothetical protein
MKINNLKTGILLLLTMIFVAGCSDDDSPFGGKDNYISSFRLKQGDITLQASISSGDIVITAPENLLLTGAKADITLSENAAISPDPSSITDWDTDRSFVVTSRNGSKATYNYRVERSVVSRDGDIVLLTQAEVEEFAALDLSRINGSLTIGAATGKDSVYSLAPLSGLKTVVYNLIVNPTYAGKDLSGLENIEQVGSLQIGTLKKLKAADFPKLTTVMSNLVVNGAGVKSLAFPELISIDKALQIGGDSLVNLSFPKLQIVVENLTLTNSYAGSKLESIEFPALEKVGGNLAITQWKGVTSINLPLLKNTIGFQVSGLPKLESLSAPKLQSTLGACYVTSCALLKSLDLTSLKTAAAAFSLEYLALENLEGVKSLSSIGGEARFTNMLALKSSQGVKSLKTVGGGLSLQYLNALEDDLAGFSSITEIGGSLQLYLVPFKKFSGFSLTKVGAITLAGYNVSTIEEIDLRNVPTNNLTLNNITTPFTLKGNDVCNYAITWTNCNIKAIEGFKEVKSLNYTASTTATEATINSVRKVQESLSIYAANLNKLSFPDLTEVGGYFSMTQPPKEVDLPMFKKIGGGATIYAYTMPSLSIPALQSIGGDCLIGTAASSGKELAEIKMPALKKVDGILNIQGNSIYSNLKLTNLNGFSALTEVKGITVWFNPALTDFSGLKNAVLSLSSAGDWKVTDNGYNPTYEQAKAGQLVKP